MLRRLFIAALLSLPALSASAEMANTVAPAPGAISLLMAEREGCAYCIRWQEEIGPIYPKTEAGRFAPLRIVDIDLPLPDDIELELPLIYSPTFLILRDGVELARIEGYPGEDFFWGLLERLLQRETDFQAAG